LGGPTDLKGGPILFSNAEGRRTNESRGASSLAGGAAPVGPPDTTGLDHDLHERLDFYKFIRVSS